ncbi:scavenger receptor cysteine-rich type 1 protein M160-like isoform X2 [Silurus asotus]|uniref:Scavenger receptor cysteine-rich type 1 protein M160-like isoform X2 n=1 Tax=Silurus asotus TaxID=30991 RepID=A0AAD5B0R0_SILAS|nr:scavenger receptor cysteine-rich type 1 protein M160-like isoform X2 [Silurus asotus]
MNYWLDEINCTGSEQNLWNCGSNGWNITQCQNYVSVVCSGNISLSLNLHGVTGECAGEVKFTTPSDVFVCEEHWDKEKANKVCEKLKCGKHLKDFKLKMSNLTANSKMVALNCQGNEDSLWECVKWTAPTSNICQNKIGIICSGYEPVHLHGGADVCEGTLEKKKYSTEENWKEESCQGFNKSELDKMCAKMKCGKAAAVNPCINTTLKCTDRVKVELRKEKLLRMCYGDVYINVNGAHQAVCVDNNVSFDKAGEVVCRELKCGSLLSVSLNTQVMDSMISHVECNGQEKSLWECIFKSDANGPCKTINVICSGSLDMRLSNGLDKCAGQLEIKHQGFWWKMNSEGWTKQNSDMVCQYLDCGDSVDNTKYIFVKSKVPALGWKLTCSGSNISQCRMQNQDFKGDVIIICKKYELWFLQGNSSCEGRVKSESGEYLQNITYEKAKDVCTRNHCMPPTNKDIIITTPPNCTAKPNSTFNCSEPQYAHVKCSGSREVRLQNKCHGKVLVCSNEKCGVCKDTWTKEQSRMLCKNLGCGDVINEQYSRKKTGDGVTIASVHCSESAQNFNQCNFVQLKDASLCQNAAYVACTGSVSAVMEDPRDKCAGNLKLFYAGVWLSVCAKGIDTNTQNAMCTMLGCGNVVSFDEVLSSTLESTGVAEVKCSDGNISNCDFSKSAVKQCQGGFLSCTGWRRLLLTSTEQACTGEVYLQNNEQIYAVTLKGNCNGTVMLKNGPMCYKSQQTKQVFHELCQQLGCSMFFRDWSIKSQGNARYVSCTGKENNLWQCNSWEDNCKDVVSLACTKAITWEFSEVCGGKLQVNYRGNWEPVCSVLDRDSAERLCQERNCGNLTGTTNVDVETNEKVDVIMQCKQENNDLRHCFKPTLEPCTSIAKIYCETISSDHDEENRSTSSGSSGTEYDDVDKETAKPPANVVTFEAEVEPQEDYDDVILNQDVIREQEESSISSDHDEENRSTSSGSSGTEYDDVDKETAKPPANVVTFEAEVEPQEDYDDVILNQDVIREQEESCEVPGPSNPPLLLSNAEAHPQEDE